MLVFLIDLYLFVAADVWKRDNIQIFATATVKFGVPRSSMLNYSFFESKDVFFVN